MTGLILVRHGTSEANAQGRMDEDGSGSPLARKGLQEAALVARRLAERGGIAAIYTSPLQRAQQTAETIGRELGLTPIVRDDLKEVGMGKAGGLTEQEVVEMFPLEWAKSGGDIVRFWEEISQAVGAEDGAGFLQRVKATLGGIVATHPQDTVVVVTHSAVHSTYLAQLVEGDPRKWPEYDVWRPCGLTELEVVEGKGNIIALNDCSHLADLSESRLK